MEHGRYYGKGKALLKMEVIVGKGRRYGKLTLRKMKGIGEKGMLYAKWLRKMT